MANWQRTLRLNPEWLQCKADEIAMQECARSIAVKLRARTVRPWLEIDHQRDNLVARFDALALAPEGEHDSRTLNRIMRDLYDWGDTMSPAGEKAA